MNMSGPAVHPVEEPPMINAVPRVRMKNIQGMPGTKGGLLFRLSQLCFSLIALSVMVTTSNFPTITAFRCLVATVSLQSLWSIILVIVDIYALLVKRSFKSRIILSLFAIGDGITSTLTFAAACASAGITVLIGNDYGKCNETHCTRFIIATAMSFLAWFAVFPSFLFNFWSLASQ